MSRFSELRRTYPQHARAFFNRFRSGLPVDFTCDADGFLKFITEIGPYPTNMVRPSVGRINHELGYVTGNYHWEELSENSAEGTSRRKFTSGYNVRRVTKEHIKRDKLIELVKAIDEPIDTKELIIKAEYTKMYNFMGSLRAVLSKLSTHELIRLKRGHWIIRRSTHGVQGS